MHKYRLKNAHHTQTGNVLVGCLIALGVFLIIIIIASVFVWRSWRGFTAKYARQGITAILNEANIPETEKNEITAHIDLLMTKFVDKDISTESMMNVIEELAESPVLPAALVISVDALYLENSALEDEEKAQAKIDLARFSRGIFNDSIQPSAINDVLKPVTTTTPDDNDIRLNLRIDSNGQTITALRSADEVSTEQLQELIATAKAKADEAGIEENPKPIDLSDTIAIAIARAIGEDPADWLPEGVEVPPEEPEAIEDDVVVPDQPTTPDVPEEPVDEPTTEPADDGP